VLGFLKSLFQPQSSSEAAKERLRVVLLSDHLSLAPEVVELLKADLLAVMSKYVEIDERNAEVTFEQRESDFALSASVPILSVKTERTATYRVSVAAGALQAHVSEEPDSSGEETATIPIVETGTIPSPGTRRRRKRRNRRLAQIQVASTTIVQASQVQAAAQAQAEPLQV
jgi:cell division topological specificity factor